MNEDVETGESHISPGSGISGWFDFEATYDEAVRKFERGATFVEVGCWLGASTAYLAKLLEGLYPAALFAVDTWAGSYDQPILLKSVRDAGGSLYPQFLRNMARCGVLDMVRAIQLPSVEAATLFDNGAIDFVFLDACHAYTSVKADICAWWPKVRRGGVLAGHDYSCSAHPGVKRAVDEVFPRGVEKKPGDCWWVEKTPGISYYAEG